MIGFKAVKIARAYFTRDSEPKLIKLPLTESYMKRSLCSYLIAFCSLLLPACGHRHGREFLGKWVNIYSPKDTLLISQDGDKFIIADPQHEIVAMYSDGTLSPNSGQGWCAYLKDSDTMNCAGVRYIRVK